MDLDAKLQIWGFQEVTKLPRRIKAPVLHVFSLGVAKKMERILGLTKKPDFCIVREAKMMGGGTELEQRSTKTPMNYTLYGFDSVTQKIGLIESRWQIDGKHTIVRRSGTCNYFYINEGKSYIHKKYLMQKAHWYESIRKSIF